MTTLTRRPIGLRIHDGNSWLRPSIQTAFIGAAVVLVYLPNFVAYARNLSGRITTNSSRSRGSGGCLVVGTPRRLDTSWRAWLGIGRLGDDCSRDAAPGRGRGSRFVVAGHGFGAAGDVRDGLARRRWGDGPGDRPLVGDVRDDAAAARIARHHAHWRAEDPGGGGLEPHPRRDGDHSCPHGEAPPGARRRPARLRGLQRGQLAGQHRGDCPFCGLLLRQPVPHRLIVGLVGGHCSTGECCRISIATIHSHAGTWISFTAGSTRHWALRYTLSAWASWQAWSNRCNCSGPWQPAGDRFSMTSRGAAPVRRR